LRCFSSLPNSCRRLETETIRKIQFTPSEPFRKAAGLKIRIEQEDVEAYCNYHSPCSFLHGNARPLAQSFIPQLMSPGRYIVLCAPRT
jgi:hypothetical protein